MIIIDDISNSIDIFKTNDARKKMFILTDRVDEKHIIKKSKHKKSS